MLDKLKLLAKESSISFKNIFEISSTRKFKKIYKVYTFLRKNLFKILNKLLIPDRKNIWQYICKKIKSGSFNSFYSKKIQQEEAVAHRK